MSCSITPVIKVKVGERHTDGERKQASRRTEMQPETVWRCGGAAVSTWRPQTCSPGRNRRSFLYGSSPSLTPPSPLPVCFLSPFLFFSFFFTRSISSHFNSSRRCVSRLRRAWLFLSPQRDSSWLLPQRKFSHVFLIKAPHRRPVRSPLMQRSKCRVFACDKKHGDTRVEAEWGPARADSLSCPSCPPYSPPTPPHRSCGHVSPPTSDSRDEISHCFDSQPAGK